MKVHLFGSFNGMYSYSDRSSLVRTTLIRQATATGHSSSSSIDRAKRQAAMLEATFSPRSKKARVAMREAHVSYGEGIIIVRDKMMQFKLNLSLY